MDRFIELISTSEGAASFTFMVIFIIVVAGGIVRLMRAKNFGSPDPAICINCDFESPGVCAQCHNKPAHDMLERELAKSQIRGRFVEPIFQPDYSATIDELNEMGLG